MDRKTEDIGLLVIHGMGEQAPFDHLRSTAHNLASLITDEKDLIRLDVRDGTRAPDARSETATITIDAVFARAGGEEQVRLHLHEVWWADLGAKGGIFAQLKFWLWGLGQWAAGVGRRGNLRRNSVQLMSMPRFGYQASPTQPPGFLRRLRPALALFAAGIIAFLTFFTWSAAKRLVGFLSGRLPNPSLIFLYLGDVKTYEEPAGHGGGTMLDPDQPVRTTIRRRMARGMMSVATKDYERWYLLAHSLGTVPAFNMLQETELALPNYLTEAEWARLPKRFKTKTPFKPDGAAPSTNNMMPRRPPWLADHDGIDRKTLFANFGGFVTYGSPLDKFAALWPRVVLLNRQAAVFAPECEWLNLHDPTDPVGGRLDAFNTATERADTEVEDRIVLKPKDAFCRSSPWLGISHTQYFQPRRPDRRSMPNAVAHAIVSGGRTTLAEASKRARLSKGQWRLRWVWSIAQMLVVTSLLAAAAGWLLLVIGGLLPTWAGDRLLWLLGWLCQGRTNVVHLGAPDLLAASGWCTLIAAAIVAVAIAALTVLLAGITRALGDGLKAVRK